MSERVLNLSAAARVARRVQLSNLYVSELSAKRCDKAEDMAEPQLTDDYDFSHSDGKLRVCCHHHLGGTSQTVSAEINVVLNLIYDIIGTEPIDENDLSAFAVANGAYHSWPFVREIYHSMTSRLGLQSFVLPTLIFTSPKPKVPTPPATPAEGVGKSKGEETRST